jgi:lipocalin
LLLPSLFLVRKPKKENKVSLDDVIKKLSPSSLSGEWFEIGATPFVHQTFEKECLCHTTNFTLKSQQQQPQREQQQQQDKDKKVLFDIVDQCINATSGEKVVVRGTLEQLMSDKYGGVFHIQFGSGNATADITKAQQKEQQKAKDDKDIKDKPKGENQKNLTKETPTAPNFLILHLNEESGVMVVSGPTVDAVWIMSRRREIDEENLKKMKELIKSKGFADINKMECPSNQTQSK